MKEKQKERKNFGIIMWLVVLIIFLNLFLFGFFSEGGFQNEYLIYIDLLPYYVDEKYVNAIRESNSYWEKREDVVFRETSSELEANVRVQWVKEFGGEHIGYTYGNEFVEIGIGDSNCLGKWKPYTYDTVLNLAKHEFGHILGYDHSNDSNDIMYRKILIKYETDIEENNLIPNDFYISYPVCTSNEVAEYSIEILSDEPINVYVVRTEEDYKKFADGEEFIHYPKCQEIETRSYKKICTISYESLIVLENPSESTAQFTIKIKEI